MIIIKFLRTICYITFSSVLGYSEQLEPTNKYSCSNRLMNISQVSRRSSVTAGTGWKCSQKKLLHFKCFPYGKIFLCSLSTAFLRSSCFTLHLFLLAPLAHKCIVTYGRYYLKVRNNINLYIYFSFFILCKLLKVLKTHFTFWLHLKEKWMRASISFSENVKGNGWLIGLRQEDNTYKENHIDIDLSLLF